MTERVLITGSRSGVDPGDVRAMIRRHVPPGATLVVGDARGVDSVAANFWRRSGGDVEVHQAHWRTPDGRFNPQAGFQRNQRMVDSGVDLCLAFVGPCQKPSCRLPAGHASHGTLNCMAYAEQAGVPVIATYAIGVNR